MIMEIASKEKDGIDLLGGGSGTNSTRFPGSVENVIAISELA
jgi:hypothetical protein